MSVLDCLNVSKMTLEKRNGICIENIQGEVQSGIIIIPDVRLPIEEGDVLTKLLPSGLTEKFEILDCGYCEGWNEVGEPACYQAKVRKVNSIMKNKDIYFFVNGNGNQVNIDSCGNIVRAGIPQDIYYQIADALKQIGDKSIQEKALDALDDLKRQTSKEKYENFVATLANHVSIITPFIPFFSQLVQG